jgi:membrane protease YdiL (CAAX protease family)
MRTWPGRWTLALFSFFFFLECMFGLSLFIEPASDLCLFLEPTTSSLCLFGCLAPLALILVLTSDLFLLGCLGFARSSLAFLLGLVLGFCFGLRTLFLGFFGRRPDKCRNIRNQPTERLGWFRPVPILEVRRLNTAKTDRGLDILD